jgi:hypothetical protein
MAAAENIVSDLYMSKYCSWMRPRPVFVSPLGHETFLFLIWTRQIFVSDLDTANFCFRFGHSKFLFLIWTRQIFVSDLDTANFCFLFGHGKFLFQICSRQIFVSYLDTANFCFLFGHGKFLFLIWTLQFLFMDATVVNVKQFWEYAMPWVHKPKIMTILVPHHILKTEPSKFLIMISQSTSVA